MPSLPNRGGDSSANKVVAAFTDGRRLKGYVYNFSPDKLFFRLLPTLESPREETIEVYLKELKAVFFVKDFVGDPNYKTFLPSQPAEPGRPIEVTFSDGETLLGTSKAYNVHHLGFFVFPNDPLINHPRVFVINQNVRKVRWL